MSNKRPDGSYRCVRHAIGHVTQWRVMALMSQVGQALLQAYKKFQFFLKVVLSLTSISRDLKTLIMSLFPKIISKCSLLMPCGFKINSQYHFNNLWVLLLVARGEASGVWHILPTSSLRHGWDGQSYACTSPLCLLGMLQDTTYQFY